MLGAALTLCLGKDSLRIDLVFEAAEKRSACRRCVLDRIDLGMEVEGSKSSAERALLRG